MNLAFPQYLSGKLVNWLVCTSIVFCNLNNFIRVFILSLHVDHELLGGRDHILYFFFWNPLLFNLSPVSCSPTLANVHTLKMLISMLCTNAPKSHWIMSGCRSCGASLKKSVKEANICMSPKVMLSSKIICDQGSCTDRGESTYSIKLCSSPFLESFHLGDMPLYCWLRKAQSTNI